MTNNRYIIITNCSCQFVAYTSLMSTILSSPPTVTYVYIANYQPVYITLFTYVWYSAKVDEWGPHEMLMGKRLGIDY